MVVNKDEYSFGTGGTPQTFSEPAYLIDAEDVTELISELELPTLEYDSTSFIRSLYGGKAQNDHRPDIVGWIDEMNMSREKAGEELPFWKVEYEGDTVRLTADYPEGEACYGRLTATDIESREKVAPNHLLTEGVEVALKGRVADNFEELLEERSY